jgi:enoyl-CoA hydratase/carnithine racemase
MQNDITPPIKRVLNDGVMTVQINRPQKKNAVTLAMWRELAQLFRSLEGDSNVRVVILAGSGDCFSAGADISEFSQVRATPDQVANYEEAVDGALSAIASLPKPTIAAISGVCFAGGVALAASADFRVADATAKFSVSAVRMGLVYNISKCARLYQIVGLVQAKRILLTGQKFSAREALDLGLVDQVADENALGTAHVLAGALIEGAPLAIEGIKSILEALATDTVDARRLDLERRIGAADASEDHREAVRAFAEKRRPAFRGR